MHLDDLLNVSFRQVMRQRRRYLGVALTIALGAAGLILIITVGGDVRKRFNQDLDLLGGATLVKVIFDTEPDVRPQYFLPASVQAARAIRGVVGVSLAAFKKAPAHTTMGRYQQDFTLMAVDGYYWRVYSFQAALGHLFGSKEVQARERICVVGAELADKVYGRSDVVGMQLEIDQDLYRVVGVLDGIGLGDRLNMAFLPLTTAEDRVQNMNLPNRLYVRVGSYNDVEEVATRLPEVITSQQTVRGLRILVAWERLRRVKNIALLIQSFIVLATFASLVLGGFGIWNMMMSAVRTRTREIGLKKAMGAEDRDILMQFLTEALTLSLGSAIMGGIMGRIGVELVALWLGSRPPEGLFFISLGLSLAFALVIGVAAGLYPSKEAARMEVVYALRYE